MIPGISPAQKHKYFLFVIPLVVLFLILIIKATYLGYSDYASYYFGSKLLLTGNYQDAYENFRLNQFIYNEGYRELFVSFTPFPPVTSIVFAPFTVIPIGISKLLFNVLSATLFTITLIRSVKYFSVSPFVLLLIPVLFFSPLRNNIFFGQSYLLLCSLLLEGYIAFGKKRAALCSLLWGIAIVFKVFPVLIILFLLIKKQYKQTGYTIIICTILLGISFFINGFAVWKYYLSDLFPRLNNGELNDSFTFIFQSAQLFFKELFVYDELLNPKALFHLPYLYLLATALFKAFIISACVAITTSKSSETFLSFTCWIFASILISPNGSMYSLILLLIPLLAKSSSTVISGKNVLILILLFQVCNIPVHYLREFSVFIRFPRLYLMIALFIVIVKDADIRLNYKVPGAFLILFLLPFFFKEVSAKEHDSSSYLLSEEKHLLIYDYEIRNEKLLYRYWSDEGSKEEQTGISVRSFEQSTMLTLDNNQIYYNGKKITNSSDHKLKPMLVNGEYIFYLSDKNRGVGMYTLRKVKIN